MFFIHVSIILTVASYVSLSTVNCPVEADPVTLLSCVAIDAVGLVEATKGNIKVFCAMAERFMECVKTKTRGCFGEEFVRGSLSELIELSQKCCVNTNEKPGEECPFVAKPNCFSTSDAALSTYGYEIPIGDLKPGDSVLAIDHSQNIISSDIVAILHYENNSQALFYTITTELGNQFSVTSEHLIFIGNNRYIQAKDLTLNNTLYILHDNALREEKIESINLKIKRGYSTPITSVGTMIVNKISSSCYSTVHSHQLAHYSLAPLRWIYNIKKQLKLINTNRIENGIHWYPKTLNNIMHTMLPTVFTSTKL
ncbi:unnamed protein product [Didymodactylos carnosus]|uniref:Hint domain-containing protein n=1 Tax=Didymodactylos carnosus TaxID=1234261 RepID=A0A815YNC9_9BILA|nr:unnamed protein product [Didymodactylos carnosus]CAF1572220.1 unnamed protein product [Didymodactylos carnosus]CAF3892055.1 unnamed protein product [Didymodactylos carnosus]CAF4435865.1 unnamed protein product [Didymodactylos carnosus]